MRTRNYGEHNQRFLLLGGPRGELTCVVPGSRLHLDTYRREWVRLATIHRPLTTARAHTVKHWAVRRYTC